MKILVRHESGESVFDADKDLNLLEQLLINDLPVEYSCKTGDCGLCISTLVDGDVFVTDVTSILPGEDILLCQTKPLSDVILEVEIIPELLDIKPRIVPFKIKVQRLVAEDVLNITIKMPPTQKLNYLPGQHIELNYKNIKRSYSIANYDADNNEIELHIREVKGGAFTSKLFANEIMDREVIRFYGPLGTFFVRKGESPILFLAGGTGYAPIKAMVNQLVAENSTRQIYVYWGMRTFAGFYDNSIEKLSKIYTNINFISVASDERMIGDENKGARLGFVHRAVLADFPGLHGFQVYACGGQVMVESAKADFVAAGLGAEDFFADVFC